MQLNVWLSSGLCCITTKMHNIFICLSKVIQEDTIQNEKITVDFTTNGCMLFLFGGNVDV